MSSTHGLLRSRQGPSPTRGSLSAGKMRRREADEKERIDFKQSQTDSKGVEVCGTACARPAGAGGGAEKIK